MSQYAKVQILPEKKDLTLKPGAHMMMEGTDQKTNASWDKEFLTLEENKMLNALMEKISKDK